MTVRLRPHHLLCMLNFVGEGYDPAFVTNYRRIAARLSGGEPVEIVTGPDDICAPLLKDGAAGESAAHCLSASVVRRDENALAAVAEILRRPLAPGERLKPDAVLLARLRAGYAAGRAKPACAGCQWHELCDRVAAGGFAGALVRA